jgi:hypothetical protein
MLFDGGFSFTNFLADVFAVFMFVIWFWLLFTVGGDLFRRTDISGWGKALWVIAMIFAPYIGVFAYLITQGRGMAERQNQQVERARDELRRVVGYSAAEEISKLDALKASGSITSEEFTRLRAKLVQWPGSVVRRVGPSGLGRKICRACRRPGNSAGCSQRSRTAAA